MTQVPGKGQELRTTPAGEKIIVYADGEAVYFNDLSPVVRTNAEDSLAYPILAAELSPTEQRSLTPSERELRRIAERRLNLAREAATLAGTRALAASTNRQQLAERLARARAAGNLTEAGAVQRQLDLARDLETVAKRDEARTLDQILQLEATLRDGNFVAAYNRDLKQRQEALSSIPPAGQDRELRLLLPRPATFTGYGTATARAGLTEAAPCSPTPALAASNGAPATTPLMPFLSYTEPSLRPFLDGKEYLNINAYTSRDGSGNYLHLQFAFTQPSARNSYGTLPAGTSLSIHFLNGKSITLAGQRESVGILNHRAGELIYDVDYPLSRSQEQTLRREAVDYIQVYWSGGYEEYPVYRVDALRRLAQCLE